MLKWLNFNYYNRTYYDLIEKTKTLYPKGNPLGQIPRNFSRKWSNAVHKPIIQM